MKLRSFIITAIVACSLQLTAVSSFADGPRYVRVSIIQDAGSLRIKINGPYTIADYSNKKIFFRGRNLNTTVVTSKDEIVLGPFRVKASKIFIHSETSEAIAINSRQFKGEVGLVKEDNGKLMAVNFIDLEDYVKGISVRELSHYWPPEALKAQVIVFRTFALYKMQESRLNDFDVTSDIYSQVYGGQAAERYRVNKAVDETRGKVLTYKNKILPAFYHATCGGYTENAALLWNVDLPALKGVVCGFCQDSPHYRWHYSIALKDIESKLKAAGFKTGKISEIKISGKSASGRAKDLLVVFRDGNLKIPAKDFRRIIDSNLIRSLKFDVSISGSDAVFEGLGWGHGSGLCQWGAYFMAKAGKNADEILDFYYPGAKISTINEISGF